MNKTIIYLVSSLIGGVMFNSCSQSGAIDKQGSIVYESSDQMVATAKGMTVGVGLNEFKKTYSGEDYFILIDVRTVSEYDHGYIPGAVSIPRGVLEFRIGNESIWDNFGLYIPEKIDPIIIYCKSGKRSVLAAETLQKLGYQNVKYLDGGWVQWHETYPELIEKIAVEENGSAPMASGAEDSGGC